MSAFLGARLDELVEAAGSREIQKWIAGLRKKPIEDRDTLDLSEAYIYSPDVEQSETPLGRTKILFSAWSGHSTEENGI